LFLSVYSFVLVVVVVLLRAQQHWVVVFWALFWVWVVVWVCLVVVVVVSDVFQHSGKLFWGVCYVGKLWENNYARELLPEMALVLLAASLDSF
jgi:hypothetical protein